MRDPNYQEEYPLEIKFTYRDKEFDCKYEIYGVEDIPELLKDIDFNLRKVFSDKDPLC